MTTSFHSLGIEERYAETLAGLRITTPAPVQAAAIPVIGEGRDAIIRSATGTGKTLAYVLPLLHMLDRDARELQLVVIVPTQELAMQIVKVVEAIDADIRTAALIGGASIQRQIERLKTDKPQIAVGTPGRLLELNKQRKLRLHMVRFAVVDEVDQVFALGGEGDVDALVRAMPRERQLVFVSATLSSAVHGKAKAWMRDPALIEGETLAEAGAAVEHHYMVCDRRDKIDVLRRLLRTVRPSGALIFVNDTDVIGEIEAKLAYAGLDVGTLYADAGKQERTAAMRQFAAGQQRLLIATDVAARGLDVAGLSHIINFEPPDDPDRYVHRAGRTGRMGNSGTVITLATVGERPLIERLAGKLGVALRRKTLSYGAWVDADEADKPVRAKTAQRPSSGGSRGDNGGEAKRTAAFPGQRIQPGRPTLSGKPNESNSPTTSSKHVASAKPTTSSKSNAPGKPNAPGKSNAPSKSDKARDRERDRKNKGAPRWLKDKQ